MNDSDDVTIEILKNQNERFLNIIYEVREECYKLRVALESTTAALAGIMIYAGNKPKPPYGGDWPELATLDGVRKYAAKEHKKAIDALKQEGSMGSL
jgi:hypothetical protein